MMSQLWIALLDDRSKPYKVAQLMQSGFINVTLDRQTDGRHYFSNTAA